MVRKPAFFAAALLLLSSSLHAQDDCIRLDYVDTLDWRGAEGSELLLADHRYIEAPLYSDYDLDGFLVRSARSDCLKHLFGDYASIVDTCWDTVTDRAYTFIHSGAGQHLNISIWFVDPETGDPMQEYSEAWVDSYPWDEGPELVDSNGQCVWRDRKSSRYTVDDVVRALHIGHVHDDAVLLQDGEKLPVRTLHAQEVQRLLLSIEGFATLEGADYAKPADKTKWRVVQIRGDAFCDAHGVVLVLNRQTGQWYTIYDIASGCSKTLDFPFYGMHLQDGHLTVLACTDCSYWGAYSRYVIDLETWRVQDLGSEFDYSSRENPLITDVQQEIFE